MVSNKKINETKKGTAQLLLRNSLKSFNNYNVSLRLKEIEQKIINNDYAFLSDLDVICFILFPKPRSQVRILIYQKWLIGMERVCLSHPI